MASNPIAQVISGTVTKVAGNGFQLADREGWVNISKFAKEEDVSMPAAGQHVKIGLDKSGYARTVRPVAEVASSNCTHAEPQAPASVPAAAATAPAPPAHVTPDRDLLIIRQSSIKAALEFLAANEKTFSLDELFRSAASVEAWVLR